MPGSLTPSLHEGLVRLGTWLPFAPAAALLTYCTGATVSASTAQRQTEAAGAADVAVQTADVARLARDLPDPPSGPAIQQLTVDGAFVPLVGGAWAEVKTLAIGAVQPPVWSAQTQDWQVQTTDLSYFSRLADHATFSWQATVETHRRGTATAGTVCAVADGADWCQQFVDLQRPDAVRILDFPHAVGYLAQAAQAVWGARQPGGQPVDDPRRHGPPRARAGPGAGRVARGGPHRGGEDRARLSDQAAGPTPVSGLSGRRVSDWLRLWREREQAGGRGAAERQWHALAARLGRRDGGVAHGGV